MGQYVSNNKEGSTATNKVEEIKIPPRSLTGEFLVGLFALAGLAALGLLSVGLGGATIFGSASREVIAEFDNVSGLERGASVEIGGVPVGQVSKIRLKDPMALVTMNIRKDVPVYDEDQFLIRTKGIIGDRYVKILRGASNNLLPEGEIVVDTTSVVDIEDLVGKLIHNFTNKE